MLVIYGAEAGGLGTASLQIGGVPPISKLDTELGLPFVSASAQPTGGSIPPGPYTVGVSGFDSNSDNMPYLDLANVTIGSGTGAASVSVWYGGSGYYASCVMQLVGGDNNCAIAVTCSGGTVTGIDTSIYAGGIASAGNGYTVGTYSTLGGSGGRGCTININTLTSATSTGSITVVPQWGPGDNGGEIYLAQRTLSTPLATALSTLGESIAQNVFHYQATMTAGQASATLTSFNQSTAGGPDSIFDHFGVVWHQVAHSGPWAEQVQVVTGTVGSSPGKITIAGPNMTLNQWAGYTLTLLAHYDPADQIQILNMPIASSTASTGGGNPTFTLTIGQNAAGGQLPDLTTQLSIADLVGVLFNPTYMASSFTDPNIANGYYPTGDTAIEAGHLVMMLDGVDAGDVQTVAGVSGVNNITVNISGTWQVTPNTGDHCIVLVPSTVPEWKSKSFSTSNKTGGAVVIATPEIQNLMGAVWLLTVRTEDIKGNTAPDFCHPSRLAYLFGAQGTRLLTVGSWTMNSWDGLIEVDCTGGDVSYECLPFGIVPNQTFSVMKLDGTANTITVNCYSGDALADGSTSWVGSTQGACLTFKANA